MYGLIQEIAAICVKISRGSNACAFFRYSGHVDRYTVEVLNGWRDSFSEQDYKDGLVADFLEPTEENLTRTRDELLEIAAAFDVKI